LSRAFTPSNLKQADLPPDDDELRAGCTDRSAIVAAKSAMDFKSGAGRLVSHQLDTGCIRAQTAGSTGCD
jgi:hypothetical protein